MGFIESQLSESRDREFIGRMHRMRTLGLGVGMLPIASVLYANDASAWAWGLLLFNGLAWPHVAWWLARRSHDPRGAEFRNLILDSAAGGAWIAVMQFNLLRSEEPTSELPSLMRISSAVFCLKKKNNND